MTVKPRSFMTIYPSCAPRCTRGGTLWSTRASWDTDGRCTRGKSCALTHLQVPQALPVEAALFHKTPKSESEAGSRIVLQDKFMIISSSSATIPAICNHCFTPPLPMPSPPLDILRCVKGKRGPTTCHLPKRSLGNSWIIAFRSSRKSHDLTAKTG